jgi:excisionase family DNA binding protein
VPQPQLLKVRESADALNCSVPMVRKMIRAGSLPVVRVGRALRVPASAVEAITGAADVGAERDLTAWREQTDRRIAQLQQQIRELRAALAGAP